MDYSNRPQSYILGDIDGLRLNADMRSIHVMTDYLVDVLGLSSACFCFLFVIELTR